MPILCIGLNHSTAPVSLREQLSLGEDQLRTTLARCGCGGRRSAGSYTELVLLSTCNRFEVYAVSSSGDFADLEALLEEIAELDRKVLSSHLYRHEELDAVRHLFRVASGLDSMVLGEPQILGQVAQAYTLSLNTGSTGLILSRLFQSAIHMGKRAHHETSISSNPATVSSVAVHLTASIVGKLAQAHVMVVGAGEMAELAVEALRKRGARKITVVNRTIERARKLADRWNARACPYESLSKELANADVVISSTAAPHTIFDREMVSTAVANRPQRPLVMMDIAVPRDVAEDVESLEQVHVYDIDQLGDHLTHSVKQRRAEIPEVEAILAEELQRFDEWYQGLAIRPVIKAMRIKAESLRTEQLKKTLRQLPDLDRESQLAIDTLTCALVKKILHEPTMCLKEQSRDGQAAQYALFARELFGLDPRRQPGQENEK